MTMTPAGRTKGQGYQKENHLYVSFFYVLLLISRTFPTQTAARDQERKAVVTRGKRGKAGSRKKRRRQL